MKRFATTYPGVVYREARRIGGKGTERIFYIRFKKDGKVCEEKVGRQYADDMTPARAARIRGERIEGKRQSRKEKREEQKAIKERLTISKLWEKYKENHPGLKGLAQDSNRFTKHIEPALGHKEPSELVPLDIDRIRINLLKTKKPATVRNVLELIRRIISYAGKKQLCKTPGFKIEMPTVNNLRTEDLTEDQMDKLIKILRDGFIIEKDGTKTILDQDATTMMMLALCSGMRRGEIFKLRWNDIDFDRGFITIKDPKGGPDQVVPLSDAAHKLLENRKNDSPFVFPGKPVEGSDEPQHRKDASKQFRAIREAAGLPKDFRPMHGLRHAFASGLASSGEVDLYTIQRLLTHKSPQMTQRYAHLRDEALRKAANLAGDIIENRKGSAENA